MLVDDYFPTFDLPAASDDGKWVAFADRLEDGGRGYPSLAVTIKNVDDDSVLWSNTVLDPDEWAKKSSNASPAKSGLFAALHARVDAVNAKLAASKWVGLIQGDATPSASEACRDGLAAQRAEADGAEVRLEGRRLNVTGGTGAVRERGLAPPSATIRVECKERNAPRLDFVQVDASRGVLLTRIAFCGDDTCWQPNAQFYATRLGR
jgi:hypothetical protein